MDTEQLSRSRVYETRQNNACPTAEVGHFIKFLVVFPLLFQPYPAADYIIGSHSRVSFQISLDAVICTEIPNENEKYFYSSFQRQTVLCATNQPVY